MNGKLMAIGVIITAFALGMSYRIAQAPEVIMSGPQGPFTTGLTSGGSDHIIMKKNPWSNQYPTLMILAASGFVVQVLGLIIKEEAF